MFGVIVGAHGNLGEELVKSCEGICGKQQFIQSAACLPEERQEDMERKYEEALRRLQLDQVIFLTDLPGGVPYNVACTMALANANYGVVSGANLSMLTELISAQASEEEQTIKQLLELAQGAGTNAQQTFHADFVAMEA